MNGNNRRLARLEPEAAFLQLFLEEFRIGPELFHELFTFGRIEQGKSRLARRCGGGRVRSGEEKWPGAEVEKIDQVVGTANVATHRADGFAEGAHLNMDAAMAIEMVDGATTAAAEDSAGVSVVDHHDAAVFFGEIAKLWQRRDVAIHRKDAVGDDQFFSGEGGMFLEDALAVRKIFVLEHFDGGFRKTRAIDDGGVIQLIGNDEIILAQNG